MREIVGGCSVVRADFGRLCGNAGHDVAKGLELPQMLDLIAIVARRQAGLAMKHDRKVAVACAADVMRNFGDGHIGIAEQQFRAFDPALENEAMRWKPGGLPEGVRKMPRTHCQGLRNAGKRDAFAKIVVEIFERAL